MNRYTELLGIYSKLDTIYTGLILLSVWSACTGHLFDWLTVLKWRIIIPIFWTLLIILYIAGIIFIGLNYQ